MITIYNLVLWKTLDFGITCIYCILDRISFPCILQASPTANLWLLRHIWPNNQRHLRPLLHLAAHVWTLDECPNGDDILCGHGECDLEVADEGE